MRFLLAGLLLLTPALAWASGAPSNCSGTATNVASAVSYPKSGATGPTSPTLYVTIQNIDGTATLWVNPFGGTAAASTAGSFEVVAGGSITWGFYQGGFGYPPPATISIISSVASSAYTCGYQ